MKKIVCLSLIAALLLGLLCACRSQTGEDDEIPSGVVVNPNTDSQSGNASGENDSGKPAIPATTDPTDASTTPPVYNKDPDMPGDDTSSSAPSVATIDASGTFKSNTGSKYLNVLVQWTAKSTAQGVLFTAELYLTSWTVHVNTRTNNQITIGGKTTQFTSAEVDVQDRYAQTHLATVTQLLPEGTTQTDVEVEYYYGGVYGGVDYDWITVSQTLAFVN